MTTKPYEFVNKLRNGGSPNLDGLTRQSAEVMENTSLGYFQQDKNYFEKMEKGADAFFKRNLEAIKGAFQLLKEENGYSQEKSERRKK